MEILNVIRCWALRENMSVHDLSSYESELSYSRRVDSSKFDSHAEKLAC